MTRPITDRPLKRRGRKPVTPPRDAADRIRALAADGFSVVGIADGLGVGKDQLASWLDRDADLKEAFDQGREQERRSLHNQLYRLAMEKDHAPSAMFLLKARHAYVEGDQGDQANRTSVTINLPGAMTLQQFTGIGKGQASE